jgi:hypothetical protein
LLNGKDAVPVNLDNMFPAFMPVRQNENLGAGRINANAESGKLAIPSDVLGFS